MKLKYRNIGPEQADNVHGRNAKDMIVLHETVSPNYPGWGDIMSVSQYLDNKDYGIHGITDNDGNIAWALGHGNAIFWHTDSSGTKGNGNVNTRGIGIEMISRVMLDHSSRWARIKAWAMMEKELNATAKLCAAIHNAGHRVPLEFSDGSTPGITTHYIVTNKFGVTGGHVDAWPIKGGGINYGGYFPLLQVIYLARRYKKLNYVF